VCIRQYEEPRAAILAGVRAAHHGAGAVINLRFLARCIFDHRAGFRHPCTLNFADETLDTFIIDCETLTVDQILPNRPALRPCRSRRLMRCRYGPHALADRLRPGIGSGAVIGPDFKLAK